MRLKLPNRTRRALGLVSTHSATVQVTGDIDLDRDFSIAQSILDGLGSCAALPPVSNNGTDTCTCADQDQVEKDGCYVCTSCGTITGNVYEVAQAWHGTHTIKTKQCYDFLKYTERKLDCIRGKIPHIYAVKIRAVFPPIYKAFFKIAPERHNFMSYGFVIQKLLDLMQIECPKIKIKPLKTPSKKACHERWWSLILERVDLKGLR